VLLVSVESIKLIIILGLTAVILSFILGFKLGYGYTKNTGDSRCKK